jgi:hypothetical protein
MVGNEQLRPPAWVLGDSVQTWWENIDRTFDGEMRSPLYHHSYLLGGVKWKKTQESLSVRSPRQRNSSKNIKDEASLWAMAGAKHVSNLLMHAWF